MQGWHMSLLACVFRVAAPATFFFFPQRCYQEIRSTPLSYHKMYAAAESSCNWLLFPLLVAKKPPLLLSTVCFIQSLSHGETNRKWNQ